MIITNAYYLVDRDDTGAIVDGSDAVGIKATIDGTPSYIPLDPDNTVYSEIQKQLAEKTLTIGSAEEHNAILAAAKIEDAD